MKDLTKGLLLCIAYTIVEEVARELSRDAYEELRKRYWPRRTVGDDGVSKVASDTLGAQNDSSEESSTPRRNRGQAAQTVTARFFEKK
jgi:hypothetical protein